VSLNGDLGQRPPPFAARRLPSSTDLDSAIALNNPSIAGYMRGGRPARDWTAHFGEIAVPTLFTVGRYDSSTPAVARYYQSLIPGSEVVVFEESAHLTMHDEPERYNEVLRAFLRKVDAAPRRDTR
jgi:pimeloyl-ACP methyl ester carboxylesterase